MGKVLRYGAVWLVGFLGGHFFCIWAIDRVVQDDPEAAFQWMMRFFKRRGYRVEERGLDGDTTQGVDFCEEGEG